MKKFLLLITLPVLLAVAGGAWFYSNMQAVSGDERVVDFVITRGSGASQIANKLEGAGLIKKAFAFKFYTQLTGSASKIQAGEYRLSPSYTLVEIVDQLLRGPVEIWVTIPEGLRREEIASRFTVAFERDTSFTDEFLNLSQGYEGKLFPDTYLFPKDASASSVVNKLVRTFESKTYGLTNTSGLSFDQAVILASILERETVTNAERPIVAGILIKRLNAGWPLQVDASVQYAVANAKCQGATECSSWWTPPTRDDLTINSPYNSYKFPGLPPAPIASPGLSSLSASLNPKESDYWYYIHDNDGIIRYARTLEEHNANIGRYLR
jgi:UPF0755 protein